MDKVILNVEGMSCEHCEKSIKSALESIDGINQVSIDLANKLVTVLFENIQVEKITEIIEEQGFDIV